MTPRRRQKTTQFFATEDEFGTLLHGLLDTGLEVFRTVGEHLHRVDADDASPSDRGAGAVRLLYLRDQATEHEPEVLPSVVKEPARFGCAILDLPMQSSESLTMGVLGAVNMWGSDEGSFFDDTAFGAYRLASEAIADLCRHPTTVRNLVDGAAPRADGVRLSDGAVMAARRGTGLVQRGVRNLRFERVSPPVRPALAALMTSVAPPDRPAQIRNDLQLPRAALPGDHRDLLRRYGVGCFDDFIWLLGPCDNPNLDPAGLSSAEPASIPA